MQTQDFCYPSFRESRNDRASGDACAHRAPRSKLRPGPSGIGGGRDGGRLGPSIRTTGSLQCPCRPGIGKRHGVDLQCKLERLAEHRQRRPAGAGPRAHGTDALWRTGADGRPLRQMGV